MIVAIADTHTAIWYLFADSRLSSMAKSLIDRAVESRNQVAVASISLAEIVYLVEKSRVPASSYDLLWSAFADQDHVFTEISLTRRVIAAMRQVDRNKVPDLPDRIVAATGVYLGVPILSRDGKIRAAGLNTIW